MSPFDEGNFKVMPKGNEGNRSFQITDKIKPFKVPASFRTSLFSRNNPNPAAVCLFFVYVQTRLYLSVLIDLRETRYLKAPFHPLCVWGCSVTAKIPVHWCPGKFPAGRKREWNWADFRVKTSPDLRSCPSRSSCRLMKTTAPHTHVTVPQGTINKD